MNKENFPLLTKTTYLNTAYVGLISSRLAEFRRSSEEFYLFKGGDKYKVQAYDELVSIHQNFASFFGLTPNRCFGIPNFSLGIRVALSLFPRNLEVLFIEEDYPSLTNAVKEQGFDFITIPMQPKLEKAIEKKLKEESVDILALSIVQYTTGLLIDQEFLKKIRETYPDLVIIGDATQFLGAHEFQFDESPFHLVAGSGYKWVLAGFGNGILMISELLLKKFELNTELIRERFFQGHFNILALTSLNFAIQQLQKHNFKQLVQKKEDLSQTAKIELSDLGFLAPWVSERKNHSSIFSLKGGEPLFHFLQEKNIRAVVRGTGVRVSFHFYNTDQDLEKLLTALKEFKSLNSHLSFN